MQRRLLALLAALRGFVMLGLGLGMMVAGVLGKLKYELSVYPPAALLISAALAAVFAITLVVYIETRNR
jgi:hypothetical protein